MHALMWLALSCASVVAQPFYQGKTVTIVVGGAAGISFDAYARVLARHLPGFIPGSPGIIIQNMPGAGSKLAAEYLFTHAPKDGTTLALLFPGALTDPLIETAKPRYDPTRFEYLGTLDQDTHICLTALSSNVKRFEDAKEHATVMAGTQPGSATVDYPMMLNALVGTKFKVVSGYKSTNETILAVERGEAEGMCSNLNVFVSQKPEWIGSRQSNVVLQIALDPNPMLTRLGVPQIWSHVSAENRPVVELIVARQVFGRPFALPPDVAQAQLAIMRTAFMATVAHTAFVKEIADLKLDLNPLDGAKVGELIKTMYAAPKSVSERMAKALRSTGP